MVSLRSLTLATLSLASLAAAFPTGLRTDERLSAGLDTYVNAGAKAGLFTRGDKSSSSGSSDKCKSSCSSASTAVSSCVDEIRGIISGAGWTGSGGVDVGVTAGLDAAAQVTAIGKVLAGIEASVEGVASVVGALEADASADVVSRLAFILMRCHPVADMPTLPVRQSGLASAAASLTTEVNAAISAVTGASIDGLASVAADFESTVSASLQTCVKGAATVSGSTSAFGSVLAGLVGSAGLVSSLAGSIEGAVGISL